MQSIKHIPRENFEVSRQLSNLSTLPDAVRLPRVSKGSWKPLIMHLLMPREEGKVEGLSSFELTGRRTGHQGLTKQIPWTPSPQRMLRASMNKLVSPDTTQFYLVLFVQGQIDAQLVRFAAHTVVSPQRSQPSED